MSEKLKDFQTEAIVLKRINFGEADRILTLITPRGRISAMAKGVRKAKSKLAGGVEMFTLSRLNLHAGKSDLYTLTGAKMLEFYGEILKDLEKMSLSGEILKLILKAGEFAGEKHFQIAKQSLEGLNQGVDLTLVETFARINLIETAEGVNLYRDDKGEKIREDEKYRFEMTEKGFALDPRGEFGAEEIKLMRILTRTSLARAEKIRGTEAILPKILEILRRWDK